MMSMVRPTEGFTLVEVIAALVLAGVLASVAGMFIVTGVKGYETATAAAEGAMRAEIAINRMYIELTGIDSTQAVTVNTNTGIAYRHSVLTPSQTRSLSYDGSNHRIDLTVGTSTYPLIGDVSAFSLSATTADIDGDGSDEIAYVDIGFNLEGIGLPFQLRVYPRNLSNMP